MNKENQITKRRAMGVGGYSGHGDMVLLFLSPAKELSMKGKTLTKAAYLVAISGILLHLALKYFHPPGISLFHKVGPLMNIIPYLICLYLTRSLKKPLMPLTAGLMVLLLDLYLFHEYILFTRIYRFLLIETYQVMFKTAVILPLGCFVGFWIDKMMSSRDTAKRAE